MIRLLNKNEQSASAAIEKLERDELLCNAQFTFYFYRESNWGEAASPREMEEASGPTSFEWMKLAESSGSLDFWNDPAENIYTEDDGEPV